MYRSVIGGLTAAILCLSGAVIAADDSSACLETGSGSLIKIDRDYGFNSYKNRDFADNTRFEGGGHVWNMQQVGEDCIGGYETTYKNPYPINLGGGANACWKGGIVVGKNPLDCGWGQLYAPVRPDGGRLNSASIVFQQAPNFIVDGIRIHNTWDAIRVGPRAPDFLIRNCWVTYNRDDIVENDSYQSGTVDDCLFDGTYVGFSSRGGSNPPGPRGVWTIQSTLIRMQPMPGAHCEGPCLQPGHMYFFKVKADLCPNFRLINNVFMVEQKPNTSAWARTMNIPPTKKSDGSNQFEILECKNNTLVWLGEGDYPGKIPQGFTITKDRSVWDKARVDWINRHPDLPRLDSDPQSNVVSSGRERPGPDRSFSHLTGPI